MPPDLRCRAAAGRQARRNRLPALALRCALPRATLQSADAIGRWSDERNVEIDPGYIAEDRESGTLALGLGIPGIPRHRLHVVPSLEWELSKGQFVYEGWLQLAREQIARVESK